MTRTSRALFTLALAAAIGACSGGSGNGSREDDSDDAGNGRGDTGPGGDTGSGGDTGQGGDTGGGGDSGPTCTSGVTCERSRDCSDGGLDNYVCESGCCVEGDDPPPPVGCGELTFEGECDGDTARWCQDDEVRELDCAANVVEGSTGSCAYIAPGFGYFCVSAPGDPCLLADSEGNPSLAFCGGTDPGCLLGTDETNCAESMGTCEEVTDPYCDGDHLVIACNQTQPAAYDCAAYSGAHCDADSGTCAGISAGDPCGELLTCADGLTCEGATSEQLGTCTGDADPLCENAAMDGDETDIDCGGGTCDPCADGLACLENSDCASSWCNDLDTCATPAGPCENGVKDGIETDVDCGGGACDPCADGLACLENSDCASDTCAIDTCEAPADPCENGARDGAETDVDCGGGTCDPCAAGLACLVNTDCASNTCSALLVCE